jgi:hypothetical protein
MRRVLQAHGPAVARSGWGRSVEKGIFEFGCAVANGSKLFFAKNGFEQKLLWLDRYSWLCS